MEEAKVGYEIDKLLVDPIEYWAHRIKGGRRVKAWGPYATEDQVQDRINELRRGDEEKETAT